MDSLQSPVKPNLVRLIDPTLYVVTTQRNSYYGCIVYQDQKMIQFKTDSIKNVKILKSNIRQITILKPEYAGQGVK